MTRKLTLSIEENIIDLAKLYAEKQGLSLSEIVEQYLKLVTTTTSWKESELTPKVKQLLGSVKPSSKTDYKTRLNKAISEKPI